MPRKTKLQKIKAANKHKSINSDVFHNNEKLKSVYVFNSTQANYQQKQKSDDYSQALSFVKKDLTKTLLLTIIAIFTIYALYFYKLI